MVWYIVYFRSSLKEYLIRDLEERGIGYYFPVRVTRLLDADDNEIKTTEKPVMANIVFLHTDEDINRVIMDETIAGLLGRYTDPMTHKCAVIGEADMSLFQRLIQEHPGEIKLLDDMADVFKVHQKVRVMSGKFEGMEGYIVRINRDRKLVVAIGSLAVAVSGISRDILQPLDMIENK